MSGFRRPADRTRPSATASPALQSALTGSKLLRSPLPWSTVITGRSTTDADEAHACRSAGEVTGAPSTRQDRRRGGRSATALAGGSKAAQHGRLRARAGQLHGGPAVPSGRRGPARTGHRRQDVAQAERRRRERATGDRRSCRRSRRPAVPQAAGGGARPPRQVCANPLRASGGCPEDLETARWSGPPVPCSYTGRSSLPSMARYVTGGAVG